MGRGLREWEGYTVPKRAIPSVIGNLIFWPFLIKNTFLEAIPFSRFSLNQMVDTTVDFEGAAILLDTEDILRKYHFMLNDFVDLDTARAFGNKHRKPFADVSNTCSTASSESTACHKPPDYVGIWDHDADCLIAFTNNFFVDKRGACTCS